MCFDQTTQSGGLGDLTALLQGLQLPGAVPERAFKPGITNAAGTPMAEAATAARAANHPTTQAAPRQSQFPSGLDRAAPLKAQTQQRRQAAMQARRDRAAARGEPPRVQSTTGRGSTPDMAAKLLLRKTKQGGAIPTSAGGIISG